MSDIIVEVLKALILILFFLISRYAIPFLKTKVDLSKLEMAINWSKKLVYAAEQIFGSGTGVQKKALVTEKLKEILKSKNIALSDDDINMLIESAVKGMNMGKGDVND